MFRIGLIAAALAAMTLVVSPAVAQYDQQQWQQKNKKKNPPQPQPQPQPQPPVSKGGGTCVPSGFARLSRNCSVNTGACQRMPEQCSLGWCCP